VSDRAKVDQVGARTCVPAGGYEDVQVIAETGKEEPNAEQLTACRGHNVLRRDQDVDGRDNEPGHESR
jgi:hypothetical protein